MFDMLLLAPEVSNMQQWLALISQRLNYITRELDGLLMDREGRGGLSPLEPRSLPESMEELAQYLAANPTTRK